MRKQYFNNILTIAHKWFLPGSEGMEWWRISTTPVPMWCDCLAVGPGSVEEHTLESTTSRGFSTMARWGLPRRFEQAVLIGCCHNDSLCNARYYSGFAIHTSCQNDQFKLQVGTEAWAMFFCDGGHVYCWSFAILPMSCAPFGCSQYFQSDEMLDVAFSSFALVKRGALLWNTSDYHSI